MNMLNNLARSPPKMVTNNLKCREIKTMKSTRYLIPFGLPLALSILGTTQAQAEPAVLSFSDDWDYGITAYFFLPTSTSGTSTVAGISGDLDLDLQDALSLLELAFSGRFEAWKGDWGIISDLNYFSLTHSASGPGSGSIDVDVRQSWLSLLGAYRVAAGAYGDNNNRYSVDLQFGARYNSLTQDIAIKGPGPGRTFDGTETWWEPVIGARAAWELNPDWSAALMADAGGFDGNYQWSTSLAFDYAAWENTSVVFGLRYYSIDYSNERSDGTFAYDITQFGPFFGFTYKFN